MNGFFFFATLSRQAKPAIVIPFICLALNPLPGHAESLWRDQNPYQREPVVVGQILKLEIDEDVQIVSNHARTRNENSSFSFLPARPHLSFLQSSEGNDRSEKQVRNQRRTDFNLNTVLAVQIIAVDQKNIIQFRGFKNVRGENESLRLNISGLIHNDDIDERKTISSKDVANLTINLQIEPPPVRAQLPPKADKPVEQVSNESGAEEAAEKTSEEILDKEQKEALMIEYLERILGELKERK